DPIARHRYMDKLRHWRGHLLSIVLFAPAAAAAHTFGTVYNLPVPFSLYVYGAAATLIVSFVIAAYFASAPVAGFGMVHRKRAQPRAFASFPSGLLVVMRGLFLVALLVAIVSGLVGTNNAYANINMTLFWVIFVLACFYLAAIVGDLFELANPW